MAFENATSRFGMFGAKLRGQSDLYGKHVKPTDELGKKKTPKLAELFKGFYDEESLVVDFPKLLNSQITDFRIQMVLMKSFDHWSKGLVRWPQVQEAFGNYPDKHDEALTSFQVGGRIYPHEAFASAYIPGETYDIVVVARLPSEDDAYPEFLDLKFLYNYRMEKNV